VSLRPGLRTHFGMGISVTQPGGLNSVINGLSKAQSQLGLNVSVNDSIHGRTLEKHAVLPLDGSLGLILLITFTLLSLPLKWASSIQRFISLLTSIYFTSTDLGN
jgi:hypothetical protein